MSEQSIAIGGQAVIEGILMRNKETIAIAVRNEKGKIILKTETIDSITKKYIFLGWPFFRGIIAFFQMLIIGIKALTYSTNIAMGEKEEQLNSLEVVGLIAISLLFSIGIFVLIPYILTNLIGFDERIAPILFNVIDGAIKMLLFILYIAIIGNMDDIRRVFQYHGAEHKAVNCYEAGKKLTIKNVKEFSTIHPRCGTSFIMFVMIVGIFLLSAIAPLATALIPTFNLLPFFVQKTILFLLRILFLLPIASLSYEVLKLAGKYKQSSLLNLVNFPGMLIQKLTTKEPDAKMIEVAITALKSVL